MGSAADASTKPSADPRGGGKADRVLGASLPGAVLLFGAPLALGMGLQTAFNLVDAYVIARLGPEVAGPSLGALGICDQLAAIGTIVSYGLTMASAALVAEAHGKGDEGEVRRIVWQSSLAVLALSLAFGGLSALLARPVISGVVGLKGDVAELAIRYLRVSGGGSFSIFFLLHLTAIQRALGSAKTPAAILVASNAVNLALAVIFVYGPGEAPPVFSWAPPLARALGVPRMELVGAAWATILARVLALAPLVAILAVRHRVFSSPKSRAPERATIRKLAKLGWPASAQFVVRIGAMLLTHSLVARAFTTSADQSATTALGIVFRLETMALFVSLGWGSAAQTFVGQNLGAGQEERATASGAFAAIYAALFMVGLALVYDRVGLDVVRFFDEDPRVVAISLGYLALVAWSYVGLGVGITLGSAITGAQAMRTTLFVDLAVVALLQLPASILAVALPGATMERLWAVVASSYVLSGAAYLAVYAWGRWVSARPELAPPSPR